MSEEQKPKEKTSESIARRMESIMASGNVELRTLPWRDEDGKPVIVATAKDSGAPPVISPFKLKPQKRHMKLPKRGHFYGIHEVGPLTSETLRRLEKESGGAVILMDDLIGMDTQIGSAEPYETETEDGSD